MMKGLIFILVIPIFLSCSNSLNEGIHENLKEEQVQLDTMYFSDEVSPSGKRSTSPFLVLLDTNGNQVSNLKKGELISLIAEIKFEKPLKVKSVTLNPHGTKITYNSNQFQFIVPDTIDTIIIDAYADYNHVGVSKREGKVLKEKYNGVIAREEYKIVE